MEYQKEVKPIIIENILILLENLILNCLILDNFYQYSTTVGNGIVETTWEAN